MPTETMLTKYERLKNVLGLYGQDLTQGMLLLVIGLILLHWFIRWFRPFLQERKGDQWPVGKIAGVVYFILLEIILNVSFIYMGLDAETVVRFVVIISLSIIAVVILLRPYFPVLPFHTGNTVLLEGLFGKVVATNLYHTQVKTFDGKTVFVPNAKILRNVVVNYHQTPGRRIKINVRIPYGEDLLRVKRILEALMIADPRVLKAPRPQVWALDFEGGSVALGARCWAPNSEYWLTKCDLTEKVKLRLDHEGIRMALPMHRIYTHTPGEDDSEPGADLEMGPREGAVDEDH